LISFPFLLKHIGVFIIVLIYFWLLVHIPLLCISNNLL
jgi:hypothetical protein